MAAWNLPRFMREFDSRIPLYQLIEKASKAMLPSRLFFVQTEPSSSDFSLTSVGFELGFLESRTISE